MTSPARISRAISFRDVPNSAGDATDTADWADPTPGNLRVDYVLPSADWQVSGSGVIWPAHPDPLAQIVAKASRHRLVWVDLTR